VQLKRRLDFNVVTANEKKMVEPEVCPARSRAGAKCKKDCGVLRNEDDRDAERIQAPVGSSLLV
jgi:hypothetical protein